MEGNLGHFINHSREPIVVLLRLVISIDGSTMLKMEVRLNDTLISQYELY